MKIRQRIYFLQFVIAGTVLLMATIAVVSIRFGGFYMQRVEWANRQLEAITSVTLHANRFSEQIAELLLIGEAERSDYESARSDLEIEFDRLEKITLREHDFLTNEGQPSDSKDELYRLERMRELQREMDAAVDNLVSLRNAGRGDEAIQLFRSDIENRLDAEFEHLLRSAVLDEQEEVELAEHEAAALWSRLLQIIAVATLAALAICLTTANRLARALLRPVSALIEGTGAISRGELNHRLDKSGDDELGVLANGFNRMAEQLESQRQLVLGAQTDLEHQVADRTWELADANERLSALDRLRVQFLADISHELRTPLTALRGEAEITLRRPPDSASDYRDVLHRIVGLAKDMSRLVEDLLLLARSENDTLRFELGRVALQAVIDKVSREGSALSRGKGIELEIVSPGEPIWIAADAQRLSQALMIVIDNAIKYSPPGSKVKMRVESHDDDASVVIRDQGQGIHADDLPHVFDRFYRGGAHDGSGLGIGLAIAKSLIEKHGGDISVTSESGSFTEVGIRIPRI
ncbi:MAG: ATP-binding protein [Woeseia sp.]